jgi:hypothetical protein
MDTWSLMELLACQAELHPDFKETAERFILFGGIVRLVLASTNYTFEQLESRVSAREAMSLLRLDLDGLGAELSQMLVHVRVRCSTKLSLHYVPVERAAEYAPKANSLFQKVSLQLASPRVIRLVAGLTWRQMQQDVRQVCVQSMPHLWMLVTEDQNLVLTSGCVLAVHARGRQ